MASISYRVVNDFEAYIAEYTGSPHAVAVDSCTNAIFLCCRYLRVGEIVLPKQTYVSVPCSVIHAGGQVAFEDVDWDEMYQLRPYPIYDSARFLARSMYLPGTFQCLSFSANKPVSIGKGGMILTDNAEADRWFRLARYMGRHECPAELDRFEMVGWNMYMSPEQAARGLMQAHFLRDRNYSPKPLYQDLSLYTMYQDANR